MKPRTFINLAISPCRTLICVAATGFMGANALAGPESTNQDVPPLSEWLFGDGITGNWGGFRPKLIDQGVEFVGSYDAEVLCAP